MTVIRWIDMVLFLAILWVERPRSLFSFYENHRREQFHYTPLPRVTRSLITTYINLEHTFETIQRWTICEENCLYVSSLRLGKEFTPTINERKTCFMPQRRSYVTWELDWVADYTTCLQKHFPMNRYPYVVLIAYFYFFSFMFMLDVTETEIIRKH